MKCTIERESLLPLAEMAQSTAPKRTTQPVFYNVHIRATSDGLLRLTATDGEISYTDASDCAVEEEGDVCVSAKDFHDMIRSLKKGKAVELSHNEEEGSLSVKSGRFKGSLYTIQADEYPLPEFSAGVEGEGVSTYSLHRAVSRVLHCASAEETRYYLCGCYFEPDGGDRINVVATDGRRLGKSFVEAPVSDVFSVSGGKVGAILSTSFLKSLLKLLEADLRPNTMCAFRIGERDVVVSLGTAKLQGLQVEGKYPDYRQVMPEHENQAILKRSSLLDSIGRIILMSPDQMGGMRFAYESDGDESFLMVSSQDTGRGSSRERIEADEVSLSIEAGYNGHYWQSALKSIDQPKVCIEYKNHLSPACIRGATEDGEIDDSVVQVVMPMRL